MVAQLFAVWSPTTLVVAIVAGALVGYFLVGMVAADPDYAAATATAAELGRVVAFLAAILGVVFYVGQAVGSWADGDPNWPRVVGRFGLWLVYAGVLGLGAWRRVADTGARRRREALAQAHREIDA